MSVGHPHRHPNRLAHTRELKNLLRTGGAPALMKRWNRVDFDFDIPYTCGYDTGGTTRFADRDFVHSLYDPAYAEKLLGEAIDTGMSAHDTLECCLRHEEVEKVILDADNPVDTYEEAHEYATAAEHELVRKKGGTPVHYERGLERIIRHCERKPLKIVPADYACAPMLDEPDSNDRRIQKELRRLGVVDAFKMSKGSTDYGLSRGPTHCSICAHWQGQGNAALSLCDVVDGLVRDNRGCNKFEARGNENGETQDEGEEVEGKQEIPVQAGDEPDSEGVAGAGPSGDGGRSGEGNGRDGDGDGGPQARARPPRQ